MCHRLWAEAHVDSDFELVSGRRFKRCGGRVAGQVVCVCVRVCACVCVCACVLLLLLWVASLSVFLFVFAIAPVGV